MKEHSGGAVPDGFTQVPFEWSEDSATPVAITHFDHGSLDRLEDLARERLAAGQDLEPLLEEAALNILKSGPDELVQRLVGRIHRMATEEAMNRILGLIIDSKHPKWTVAAMAQTVGFSVIKHESVPETAARFGKRKQALFQEMEHVEAVTGICIKRSNQRDEGAREKMRVANFRHRG